jgi:hypothetical protein
MSKPNDPRAARRLAALTGIALLAAAAFLMQLPLGAQAGVAAKGGVPTGQIARTAPTPESPPVASKATGTFRLRCWQYGRLLFDEGPVSLAGDARLGAKLVATDRNGALLLVTEAGGATCLARAPAPPPNLALPQ